MIAPGRIALLVHRNPEWLVGGLIQEVRFEFKAETYRSVGGGSGAAWTDARASFYLTDVVYGDRKRVKDTPLLTIILHGQEYAIGVLSSSMNCDYWGMANTFRPFNAAVEVALRPIEWVDRETGELKKLERTKIE